MLSNTTATLRIATFAVSAGLLVAATLACDTPMTMQGIEDQVAEDTVRQYNIAKRQGDAMQRCVQAGLAAAAFLQAENEDEYNTWKSTERRDCRAAGLR